MNTLADIGERMGAIRASWRGALPDVPRRHITQSKAK